MNDTEREEALGRQEAVRYAYKQAFDSRGGEFLLNDLAERVAAHRLKARSKVDPSERVLWHDRADEVEAVLTFITDKLAP